eukprot:5189094-Amphidinium_carterae.1
MEHANGAATCFMLVLPVHSVPSNLLQNLEVASSTPTWPLTAVRKHKQGPGTLSHNSASLLPHCLYWMLEAKRDVTVSEVDTPEVCEASNETQHRTMSTLEHRSVA